MADLFEQAAERKLRFETIKGNLTAEDLFDLPLQLTPRQKITPNLEGMWIVLNKEIKEQDTTESPLKSKGAANKELALKFAIVSRVIEIRMTKREEAKNSMAKKARNEQIMRLIADKENDALAGKSIEELRALME